MATTTTTTTNASFNKMWRDDGKMPSFASRRSPILGRHGMVASSQPLVREDVYVMQ